MNQQELILELTLGQFAWVSFFVMTVVGFLVIAAFGVFAFLWGVHVKTIEQLGKARECQKRIDELVEKNKKLGIAIKLIQQRQQDGLAVSTNIIVDAAEANIEIQLGIAQLARGFSGTAGVEVMTRQQKPRRQISFIARPGL